MNDPDRNSSIWLPRFAKLVVAMTFLLILVGGHTTTTGAGMAFADWPLSHNSLNPDGWWSDLMQRLEHGHRLLAETVGLLIGILCAWTWARPWSVPIALLGSVLVAGLGFLLGAPRPMVAHLGLWSSALLFGLAILWPRRRPWSSGSVTVRGLAFAAFVGVLLQAVMGGLRVTTESGGDPALATVFRVVHGCIAQLELCLLVTIAAITSPGWQKIASRPELRAISQLGWFTAALIFCQLIVGASMRHLGAGLAIPSFPHTSPEGDWLPQIYNPFTYLNFTHTRVGALLVTACVLLLVVRALAQAGGDVRVQRPAALLVLLLTAQVTLGLLVIWQLRPPVLTTLHVLNGAALLATTVLLSARASRAGHLSAPSHKVMRRPVAVEVAA